MTIINTKWIKKQKVILSAIAYLMLSTSPMVALTPDDELAAVHLSHRAQQFKHASEAVDKFGRKVGSVGEVVSKFAPLDVDPLSGPIVQAIGAGLTAGGIALQRGIGPILENHALTLENKALRKSAPLSISESIEKKIDDLQENRTKLLKKCCKATEEAWYRKLSDKLRLSHPTKRLAKAAKYGKQLSEVDQKINDWEASKEDIGNIIKYLDNKAVQRPLTNKEVKLLKNNINQTLLDIDELYENTGYLIGHATQSKHPNLYKDLIKSKERKLIRL